VAGAPATIRLRVQHEVADLAVHLVDDREARALSECDRPCLEDLRHHVLRRTQMTRHPITDASSDALTWRSCG
jgi:hypothetical protein